MGKLLRQLVIPVSIAVCALGGLSALAFTDNPIRGIAVEQIRLRNEKAIAKMCEEDNRRNQIFNDGQAAIRAMQTRQWQGVIDKFCAGEPVTVMSVDEQSEYGYSKRGLISSRQYCVHVASTTGDTMDVISNSGLPEIGSKWTLTASAEYPILGECKYPGPEEAVAAN